jgi:hypothetical protein
LKACLSGVCPEQIFLPLPCPPNVLRNRIRAFQYV